MSYDLQRPFDTPIDLVVPAASRRITTPVEGSGSIVLSDLVPTVAITPTWPVKGVTTYGTMSWTNKTLNADQYANYIYQKAEREYRSEDFTRLYYSPNNLDPTVPYDTIYTSEVMTWPAVLEFFQTYRVPGSPIMLQTSAGPKYVPRFTVVYGLRRSVSGHCKMRVQKFLSATPFDEAASLLRMFEPTDIMWDMPGSSGSIERCLHDTIKVRAARDNIDWAVDTPRYMVFPETNLTEWTPITWLECDMVDVLYRKQIFTIYPPSPPEVSIYVE